MRINVDSLLSGYGYDEDGEYDKRSEKEFELVGELDEPDMSYEFHTFGVFRHIPTGRMWWATTSGCSCPSPYEEYFMNTETLESNMNEITPQNQEGFEKAAMDFCSTAGEYHQAVPIDQRRDLVNKVRGLLSEVKSG